LDGSASTAITWFAKEKAMTTPFVRPALQGRPPAVAAPCPGTAGPCQATMPTPAPAQSQTPSALQQAMHLDLQTSWPTHRIRSFLSLRAR
jgi:hypothetical protein